MRTIIAGSRSVQEYKHVINAVAQADWVPTVILSGTARGADVLGELWAINNSVELEKYPADWELYGKKAGFLRNVKMARHADALIALWDGTSSGTAHMIDIANDYNLDIYVHMVE